MESNPRFKAQLNISMCLFRYQGLENLPYLQTYLTLVHKRTEKIDGIVCHFCAQLSRYKTQSNHIKFNIFLSVVNKITIDY